MKRFGGVALLVALALAAGLPADAAKKKKRRRHVPAARPTPRPLYGPPAPVPAVRLRAAGSCLSYEPGHFILLAEVGQHGRMFRIDGDTVFHFEPRRGARIRLVYVETPDGPVAREVLPGPAESAP